MPKEYTCKECNITILSQLDQHLIDFPGIAFFRVHFLSYTKHGKRPKAGLQNISLQKLDDERVLIFIKDKSGLPSDIRKRSDNQIEYNLLAKGKTIFQPKLLGRALYKIALGALAFEYGQDRACQRRYDDARAFITHGRGFSNNLAMLLVRKEEPRPRIEVYRLIDLPGTVYEIRIYGLTWVLNLEPSPILQFNNPYLPMTDSFLNLCAEFSHEWVLYPLNNK